MSESNPKATKRERLRYIDVLNVVAAFAVVVLHCNGCFWLGPAQGRSWVTANIIETVFYWPVPVFFMISGATLMDYRDRMDTKTYLKRRFWRTVVPFLVWSLIGFAYQWFLAFRAGRPFDTSLPVVISNIINTKYVNVYWFFPCLFAAYLSIPILSQLKDRESVFRYMIVVGLVFVSLLPLVFTLCGMTWNAALAPPPVTGYILYIVLGYLLANKDFSKRGRRILYALAVGGWLLQLFGTFVLSTPEAGVSKVFKGYTNLPTVLQSIGAFVFVRHIFSHIEVKPIERVSEVCAKLAPYTFGVYLIHWFVLNIIGRLGLVDAKSIVWRTVGAACVFGVCVLVTMLYKHMIGVIRSGNGAGSQLRP